MCRYAQYSYKKHYACFRCRKVFRRPSPWDAAGDDTERTERCPECRAPMADMGMDLKAPKKSAVKEWAILESLFRMGRRFQTCGCDGPGYIPTKPSDHRRYLEAVAESYRKHLAEAQAITTGSRRKKGERVDYWADRLALVEAEMLRVGARS